MLFRSIATTAFIATSALAANDTVASSNTTVLPSPEAVNGANANLNSAVIGAAVVAGSVALFL